MRVLESILMFVSATANDSDFLEKDKSKAKSFNRLVTLQTFINRHAVACKGGNPNVANTYGLEDKPDRINRIDNAIRINNVFFKRNLARMYEKRDKNGELKCAIHQKERRGRREAERRRRDLSLDQDDWENYCDMLAEAHDPEDGECSDCCETDENGNYVFSSVRGVKNTDTFECSEEKCDPEDFVKKTRKIYSVLRKWVDTYLSACNGNSKRYGRVVNLMSARLYNGIDQGFTTFETIKDARWKRAFPSKDPNNEFGHLNKELIFSKIQERLDNAGD
jgi:hypothetical protein